MERIHDCVNRHRLYRVPSAEPLLDEPHVDEIQGVQLRIYPGLGELSFSGVKDGNERPTKKGTRETRITSQATGR